MRTAKQQAASRRNGQRSSGPITAEGKARCIAAPLKTAIHAKSHVLPSEDPRTLDQLTADYYAHHNPTTPEARLLLDELIDAEWLLRRLRTTETQLWKYAFNNVSEEYRDHKNPLAQSYDHEDKTFARLQTRINSTRAAYHRTLAALKKLESEESLATQSTETPLPVLRTLRKPATEAVLPHHPDPRPLTHDPVPLTPSPDQPYPEEHSNVENEIRS